VSAGTPRVASSSSTFSRGSFSILSTMTHTWDHVQQVAAVVVKAGGR
jgi:hypothetical protein